MLRVKYNNFKIKVSGVLYKQLDCEALNEVIRKKVVIPKKIYLLNKKEYANGHKDFEIKENTLTYFFLKMAI